MDQSLVDVRASRWLSNDRSTLFPIGLIIIQFFYAITMATIGAVVFYRKLLLNFFNLDGLFTVRAVCKSESPSFALSELLVG